MRCTVWGRCGTNPKILESLEGPEGYLCPGIHILGIISICGKPFYTSDEGLLIFFKSQLQNFCYQAELHATLPHCARVQPQIFFKAIKLTLLHNWAGLDTLR